MVFPSVRDIGKGTNLPGSAGTALAWRCNGLELFARRAAWQSPSMARHRVLRGTDQPGLTAGHGAARQVNSTCKIRAPSWRGTRWNVTSEVDHPPECGKEAMLPFSLRVGRQVRKVGVVLLAVTGVVLGSTPSNATVVASTDRMPWR
jgi:hypothetical protein